MLDVTGLLALKAPGLFALLLEDHSLQHDVISSVSMLGLGLQDMGGGSMGIWCAHGEGKAHFPDPQVKQTVLEGGLAPIRRATAHKVPSLLPRPGRHNCISGKICSTKCISGNMRCTQ